ncbi:UNVERIFIED_CONTAM: Adaptor for signal transduction [Siphonaria sp. JEL0065]|nr:Adaptor for signal transduction [Siphonaria sp. JEL0065]
MPGSPNDNATSSSTANPNNPNNRGSATVGTIRICLDCIFNYENESTNKNFRVSDTDVCSKILAGILKKYNISETWKSFCLYIRIGGQERRLNYDEKPLALQNKMKDEGSPSFTIKRTTQQQQQQPESSSPITLSAPSTSSTFFPSSAVSTATTKRFPSLTNQSTATTPAIASRPTSYEGKTFIAVYNYKAARDDELNVVMGDRFKIIKKDRDWFTVKSLEGGSNGFGAVGWVPSGCLKEFGSVLMMGAAASGAGTDDDSSVGSSSKRTLVPGGIQRLPGIPVDLELPVPAVILYDYDGSGTTNALAVKAGAVLTILKKEDSWLYGKLGDKKGWVPDAYVSVISGAEKEGLEKYQVGKIAALLDHFNDNLMEDQRMDVKMVQLTSGKSVNLSDLWKSVNLALGRWIEMESRGVSVLNGDKSVILEQLSSGLKWVSLISGKTDVIRQSPKRDEIVLHIVNASDACKVIGAINVDEDRQLEASPLSRSIFSSTSSAAFTTAATSKPLQKSDALKEYVAPSEWSTTTKDQLNTLRSQKSFSAIVEVKQRPYFVALNDVIVTMRMNDLKLGDVISLDRVREIGTEEFILQGNPYVHPNYFSVKAVVIEHPVSQEIVRHHWKKRGHQPVHVNRNHHTALRVCEISINKV